MAFSTYMLVTANQQTKRIELLVEQTKILRSEIDYDHDWQVHHHKLMEQMERIIRDGVIRKEALIRAALKREFHWTESDIDSAIESERKNVRPDDPTNLGPEPSPPLSLFYSSSLEERNDESAARAARRRPVPHSSSA